MYKQLIGSEGTSDRNPIAEYFLFIVIWALGSLLFLTILFGLPIAVFYLLTH